MKDRLRRAWTELRLSTAESQQQVDELVQLAELVGREDARREIEMLERLYAVDGW